MFQLLARCWEKLSKQQKVSVCILGVCGIFVFGFSFYRLRSSVYAPFLTNKSELAVVKSLIGPTPEEEVAKQKRTDTDGDSLSDWDELNIYKTNPYLKDTCGDGLADNVRLATGKNLVCSSGATGAEESAQTSFNLLPTGMNIDQGIFGSAVSSSLGTQGQQQVSGQMLPRDAATIRQVLKGKVDQSKLDAITDQQLLELYDQAMAIQNQSQGAALQQATSVTPQ